MAEVFSSQSGNEIFVATRDAINAAAQANVNVFALDPRGLIGMTTDFVDNMRAGAPDVMGTDRNRPVGTPVQRNAGAARRNAADTGQPADDGGRHGRIRRRRHELVRSKRSAASSTPTAATTCSDMRRPHILAMAGFIASK